MRDGMRVDKTKWTKTILSEITHITMGQSPDSSSYNKDAIGLPFYQGNADFGPIHPTPRIYCDAPTRTANEHELLISVRAPIGAINITNELCCIGRGLAAIQMIDGKSYLHFIKYILKAANEELNRQGTGMTFKAISKKVLFNLTICLPTFDIQQTIASELDAIQTMIDGYKAQIADLDALAQSIFHNTFGNVAINDKCWNIIPMGQLGNFKNGLNYSKEERGKSVKIIGVGDFHCIKCISSFDNISYIEVEDTPQEYLLHNEDIIFVRSNGNKNLVGRCLEVFPNNTEVTFSGFCIRFRKSVEIINKYLISLLTDIEFKNTHILKSNGIGIQNINQKLLSSLPIPVPPIDIQKKYAIQVEAIEKQKELIRQQLTDAETLMAERMQYYFS